MMQFSRIRLFASPFAGLTLIGLASGVTGLTMAPAFAAQHSVEISVTNTGDEALECGAAIAHWFSEDLGTIAPGKALKISFGYDLTSGTVFRRNEVGDEMAVQRVWCGRAGEAWKTRAEITLPRDAGIAPPRLDFDCAAAEKSICAVKAE